MEGIIEILKIAWFGHEVEGLIKFEAIITAAIIGGAASLLGGFFGSRSANRRAKDELDTKRRLEKELKYLEDNRQAVINPYSGVKSIAGMFKDLSGMITNPFDNLGVATKAAEIQMEQSDIALANTLDTIRATGASAGGATALAQAALASKKNVAASIETQEATNEKLRAEGRQQLQRVQMAEATRLQSAEVAEALRLQQVGVAGQEFMYRERERRKTEQLNRKQAQITGAAQAAANQQANAAAIMGAGISGVANIAGQTAAAMYNPRKSNASGFDSQQAYLNSITNQAYIDQEQMRLDDMQQDILNYSQ
tara:strand:+ start:186 stop:1115 length:930 start_codon:yes stop_codon:yes gene_type:complete